MDDFLPWWLFNDLQGWLGKLLRRDDDDFMGGGLFRMKDDLAMVGPGGEASWPFGHTNVRRLKMSEVVQRLVFLLLQNATGTHNCSRLSFLERALIVAAHATITLRQMVVVFFALSIHCRRIAADNLYLKTELQRQSGQTNRHGSSQPPAFGLTYLQRVDGRNNPLIH